MGKHDHELRRAVRYFWKLRVSQAKRQGSESGQRDQGSRKAVTGGKQMNGFEELVTKLLISRGVPRKCIYSTRKVELPGFYRPEKKWDLLAVVDGELLAAIEFKSHVGPSFGNNFNNRTEEALGNASDLWTAYREGAFRSSPRPWLGYLMLLEETPGSTRPLKLREPHFQVFEEFAGASYAQRYELLLTKLVRERMYDATCLLLSDAKKGKRGDFQEPAPEIGFSTFISSLSGRISAHSESKK